jgi:inner membrane protein
MITPMSPELIWFIAGLVMILAEFALPGIIFVFIGLGAWVTSLVVGLGWAETLGAQLLVFGVSSALLVVCLRSLFKSWLMGKSVKDGHDEASEEFLGKLARALTAMPSGAEGKVEFKGAHWSAMAESEVSAGDSVLITGRDGLRLTVRRR